MAPNVYVDGPNLYYAALRHRPVRWLDLTPGASDYCPTTRSIGSATSPPGRTRPSSGSRSTGSRCTSARSRPKISVHLGRCLNQAVRLRKPRTPNEHLVTKVRMKGVDVALASQLLADAATGDCDTVVLVSNDSDFKPTIVDARRALGERVGLVNPSPRGRVGSDKRKLVNFHLQPPAESYAAARFPAEMADARSPFHAPKRWFETDPGRR